MSNTLWACVSIAVFVAGIFIGVCVDGRQSGESRKTVWSLEELIDRLRSEVVDAQSMAHEAWESTRAAKDETQKYKEMWADELQKRLDLAEKLNKYTGGTPSESMEDTDGEVPAGY